MNAVFDDVVRLVDKELESANEKFPLFNSPHEGYAVMMEELDELGEYVDEIAKQMNNIWTLIRKNSTFDTKSIYNLATMAAVEAIQVAAMARKYAISEVRTFNKRSENE